MAVSDMVSCIHINTYTHITYISVIECIKTVYYIYIYIYIYGFYCVLP